MRPVLKGHVLAGLFVLGIAWGAAALGLAFKLGARLASSPAAIFAVTLAALLAAAFLRAAARRRDLLTLTFSEHGGEVKNRGRIVSWRWSDLTAVLLDADQLLFEYAFVTIDVPLKAFQNRHAVTEYVEAKLPELSGPADGDVRLMRRRLARTHGPGLVYAVFLFCGAVYMDFARRVLVDCGLPPNRFWAACGLFLLGASIAKLWLEVPWYGAATLSCSLYFAVVAGIQHPLHLNAGALAGDGL